MYQRPGSYFNPLKTSPEYNTQAGVYGKCVLCYSFYHNNLAFKTKLLFSLNHTLHVHVKLFFINECGLLPTLVVCHCRACDVYSVTLPQLKIQLRLLLSLKWSMLMIHWFISFKPSSVLENVSKWTRCIDEIKELWQSQLNRLKLNSHRKFVITSHFHKKQQRTNKKCLIIHQSWWNFFTSSEKGLKLRSCIWWQIHLTSCNSFYIVNEPCVPHIRKENQDNI